jgi:hypothetical protein
MHPRTSVLETDAEHSTRHQLAEKGAACREGQACWEKVRQYDGMRRRLTSSEDCLPNKLLVESYGPRMRTGVPRRLRVCHAHVWWMCPASFLQQWVGLWARNKEMTWCTS